MIVNLNPPIRIEQWDYEAGPSHYSDAVAVLIAPETGKVVGVIALTKLGFENIRADQYQPADPEAGDE
jgi:hypothetical protein